MPRLLHPEVFAALLAFLLLGHALLMATDRHAQVMCALHGEHRTAATPVEWIAAGYVADSHAEGLHSPLPLLDDCPAQQATLPQILAFILLLVALWQAPSPLPASCRAAAAHHAPASPPPLAPPQRRALLQVFLI